jgi:hypothetical protein
MRTATASIESTRWPRGETCKRALAAHVIARLTEHPDRYFAVQAAWAAHLEKLGIAAL